MSGWEVVHLRGTAQELHDRPMPDPPARTVEVLTVTRPAIVLGSTQAATIVDGPAAAAQGIDVARRRSGGGAVLLVPGESLWVDVVLPPSDALWQDDVGRAFHWLGEVWVAALADLGVAAQVHRGGLCTTAWSRLVCFGGLGSGEVTTMPAPERADARPKLVGLSQRRGRMGARFQCTVHRRWSAAASVELLALDPAVREAATAALQPVVATVDAEPAAIAAAFLRHLP